MYHSMLMVCLCMWIISCWGLLDFSLKCHRWYNKRMGIIDSIQKRIIKYLFRTYYVWNKESLAISHKFLTVAVFHVYDYRGCSCCGWKSPGVSAQSEQKILIRENRVSRAKLALWFAHLTSRPALPFTLWCYLLKLWMQGLFLYRKAHI